MTESFNILVNKLNSFRQKYYLYKLAKGVLLSLLIIILSYTVVSVVEYYAYLPSLARTFILYAGIALVSLLFIQFIIYPLFQLFRIIKQLSNENINKIIVIHFPEIKDKLLNVLELSKLEDSQYSTEIVLASIDQKINDIKIFDFKNAINFKQLRYIGLYLLVSVAVVTGIVIFDKPVIAESNYRFKNYDQQFSKPAPFNYFLQNENLVVNKGDEYTLSVECRGESLPQVVYINIEGNNFLMKNKENGIFEYKIESVINSFEFYFTDLNYVSESYELKTLPKPGISEFMVRISPPEYTRIANEEVKNVGDLKVAEGTRVEWNFKCIDTDSLYISFEENKKVKGKSEGQIFRASKSITENSEYRIYVKNNYMDYREVLAYNLTVIPDMYPEIKVVQTRDSSVYSRFYFMGEIADDYGFSSLDFHMNVNNEDSIFPLQVTRNLLNQQFYYTVDFNDLNIGSEEVSYYFSVSDNDGVNGAKTTTSSSYVYTAPNREEIRDYDKEQFTKIEDMVNQSQELANEIREGLKELQFKNLDSNVSDWEKSQLVNDIVKKKDQLEQLFDQVKQQNEDLNNFMDSFTEQDQEMLDKQEQIEELLEEVFSDELKELMEEFQKLAEEFNEKKFNNMSEKLDMSMEDLSKQLDRNLEMLKKMKVEQKLQNIVDDMYELAAEEEKLAQEVSDEKNYDEVKQKDQENKEKLDELQKELNDAMQLNEELKEPLNYDNFENEINEIKKSFEENQENLGNKKRNKSSQGIKGTSEQIQNLAFSMDQLLQSNMMQQNAENIENIRQILSNLIYFSFSQEDIMEHLTGMDINDPVLNSLKRSQRNLKDQSVVIKDSLYALANRTPEISNMINGELLDMTQNLNRTQEMLDEGAIPPARTSQQFVLTAVNNLALFLNEALDQLEDQMASSMGGNQNCENPGNKPGGQNLDMMKQSSESIKQQLQKMIDEMKSGNSQGMSKMLGESLMQHEMMQQMLREMMNNGSVGSSAREQLKNIDKLLEENRKELMNRNISQKTLMRQNQIMTRLLEAEKSEIERDIDNKRESETADEEFYSNPVRYFEYNKKSENAIENLEQNSFKLNNFYNKKYKKYLNTIDGQGK